MVVMVAATLGQSLPGFLNLSFELTRMEYAIRFAYSMTNMTEAQSHRFDGVNFCGGVNLLGEVFSHGQLYVRLS
jgi:hypothetical protein